jgi:nucleoside-diphosphate-sugar epimerase
MVRSIIVTGATGKQGRALINALLAPAAATTSASSDFEILAVTRNTESESAKRLASQSSAIKLIKGDFDNVPGMFDAAAQHTDKVWGVFSLPIVGKFNAADIPASPEAAQGVALINEARERGVEHFVYSSVDRGGEAASWDRPTTVPHFRTKHYVEHYLRDNAGSMGWTILRPVIFYDNLEPNFGAKIFLTLLRDRMGDKTMPWISTKDIGIFGALAFRDPVKLNHRALSLGGEPFNWEQMNDVFVKVTGSPTPTTYSFLGSALNWAVEDVRTMLDFWVESGYKTDVEELRSLYPGLQDLETWLREESKFPKV